MNTHTKNKGITSIVLIVALITLTVPVISRAAIPEPPLEGAWDSQVTLTDCNGVTIGLFEAYQIFIRGGTLMGTDNMPPTSHGPVIGTWRYLAGQIYAAHFQTLNFNPDGTYAGFTKVNRRIVLDASGKSYTADATFEIYDHAGALLASGCGTEDATRLP